MTILNTALNEDWIKSRHWDLPTTLDQLLLSRTRTDIKHLTQLPAWRAAPRSLVEQVHAYLAKDESAPSPRSRRERG